MNIFPVHTYEPKDRPWVIRMLRYLGFFEVIAAILAGIYYGGNMAGPLIQQAFNLPSEASLAITVIFGGFVGFCAGLIITVPTWGLAMLLDDIHAIQVQTAGYVAMQERNR